MDTGDIRSALARPSQEHSEAITAAQVRLLIQAHRLRSHYIGVNLFNDPCWVMLLELLLARVELRPIQASSVGICAGVPPATAHRWLERLVKNGLVVRTADNEDGRRVFVELSDFAAGRILSYLKAVSPFPRNLD